MVEMNETTKCHVSNSELFFKPMIILLFIESYIYLIVYISWESGAFFSLLALYELGRKIYHFIRSKICK